MLDEAESPRFAGTVAVPLERLHGRTPPV
jgi:hypothetical protein